TRPSSVRSGAPRSTPPGVSALPLAQVLDQAGGVPAAAAGLLDEAVELVDERRHRQRRAVAAGLVEAHREVLAHPVDREAEIEAALGHGLPAVLHLPG